MHVKNAFYLVFCTNFSGKRIYSSRLRFMRFKDIEDDEPAEPSKDFRGAGGTPGGIGEFFFGLILTVIGAYLLTNQVRVSTSYWSFWGYNTFGISLLPLIFGIFLLFFNGKSIAGWLVTTLGVIVILAGIIVNLQIYFEPTSLFNTILMLILLFGGLGLVARSLFTHK